MCWVRSRSAEAFEAIVPEELPEVAGTYDLNGLLLKLAPVARLRWWIRRIAEVPFHADGGRKGVLQDKLGNTLTWQRQGSTTGFEADFLAPVRDHHKLRVCGEHG